MPVRAAEGGVTIALRVQPRSPRARIDGEHDGALKLRVTAPPVDGAANAAVIDFLSKQLRVPKRDITIIQGETSRTKVVFVAGLTEQETRAALGVG